MLLVHNSTLRETAASGLARERALITMHLGITLGIGGPVCSNVIRYLTSHLPCAHKLKAGIAYSYCPVGQHKNLFRV
jgi:hypothetical protein